MRMMSSTMMGRIVLPPPALLPRLDRNNGQNNSFSADEQERASTRGGSRSDTASARGGSRSDAASAQGGSCSDTVYAQEGGRQSDTALKEGVRGGNPSKEGMGGGQKKSHAFTQQFKTPRKSQDNDDSEDNGFLFQNMMRMMMYQSRAESEQRKRQSRIEVEAEQREQEHQLCREEMVIAREDTHAQRQLMNAMMKWRC